MDLRSDTRRDPSGLLVAFEGIDGAGKTTQALRARDALLAAGRDAVYLREPSDGPVGRRLRALLGSGDGSRPDPETEFRLFVEDRADDVERNIAPALARGAIVLIDRYYVSSMAYQGALGLDPDRIRRENEAIAPRPHLTLLFRIPTALGQGRLAGRGECGGPARPATADNPFERAEYQERVGAIFESLVGVFPGLIPIDASMPPDAVHATVMGLLEAAGKAPPPVA